MMHGALQKRKNKNSKHHDKKHLTSSAQRKPDGTTWKYSDWRLRYTLGRSRYVYLFRLAGTMAMMRPRPRNSTPNENHAALQTRTQTRTCHHAILVVMVGVVWSMLSGLVDAIPPLATVTPSISATTIGQRRQAQENDPLTLSLDFSLWFPSTTNVLAAVERSSGSEVDSLSNNELFVSSDIVAGVLEGLLELLCTATDMNVMDLSDQDVCALHDYTKQQSPLPIVLQEDPRVTIRRQHLETTMLPLFGNNIDAQNKVLPNKEYYEMTVQYTLVRLSDTYLQHATTTTTNNAKESAMRTMEQSIQLALDLSIMEGDFDVMLAKHMPPVPDSIEPIAVYSSPTGRESTIFGRLAVDLLLAAMSSSSSTGQDMSRYERDPWNPMRTSGLALLGSMLLLCTALGLLAGRRRKSMVWTLEEANDTNKRTTGGSPTLVKKDTTTAFMLQSPEGVDSFLNQSTPLRFVSSSPSEDIHDLAAGDLQDEDDEETRIPLPFQLH